MNLAQIKPMTFCIHLVRDKWSSFRLHTVTSCTILPPRKVQVIQNTCIVFTIQLSTKYKQTCTGIGVHLGPRMIEYKYCR